MYTRIDQCIKTNRKIKTGSLLKQTSPLYPSLALPPSLQPSRFTASRCLIPVAWIRSCRACKPSRTLCGSPSSSSASLLHVLSLSSSCFPLRTLCAFSKCFSLVSLLRVSASLEPAPSGFPGILILQRVRWRPGRSKTRASSLRNVRSPELFLLPSSSVFGEYPTIIHWHCTSHNLTARHPPHTLRAGNLPQNTHVSAALSDRLPGEPRGGRLCPAGGRG